MFNSNDDLSQSWELSQSGKTQEALAIVNAVLLLDANNVEAYLLKSGILEAVGNTDEALRLLFKAKALAPDNARPDFALACIYQNNNNHTDELRHWQSASEKPLSFEMKAAQGQIAFYQKRYKDAIGCFQEAITFPLLGEHRPYHPEFVWLTYLIGVCSLEIKDYPYSERCFEGLVSEDVRYKANLFYFLGKAKWHLRKYEQAEYCLVRVIEIDPNFYSAYIGLSRITFRAFHFGRAFQYLRKAVVIGERQNSVKRTV